jgi:hypothetical protein
MLNHYKSCIHYLIIFQTIVKVLISKGVLKIPKIKNKTYNIVLVKIFVGLQMQSNAIKA